VTPQIGADVQPQELQAVARVARDILSDLDLESTLLSVVNTAKDLFAADIVGILLAEPDDGADGGEVLTMRACAGHRTIRTARLRVRGGQGVAGKVLQTGQPQRVDDYPQDRSISGDFLAIAAMDGTRSALGAPMIVRDRVIGVLMVWSRRPAAFTDLHTETLVYLADLATIAIENARLYDTERTAMQTLAEAHHRLEEQYAFLQRASDVHEELTGLVLEGRGLPDLAGVVARHTGGDVVIFDPDLDVLATAADEGSFDPAVLDGARCRLRATPRPHREREPAEGPIAPSATLDRWLLVRDVVAGGERLARLCVALHRPPAGLDPVIVEQAAVVCALELTKERAVTEAHSRLRSDFLWDLLDGNLSDDSEALVRARYLGYTLPSRLRVMLTPVAGLDEWARTAGASADAVDRRRESLVRLAAAAAAEVAPGAFVARRGSLLAFLLPASGDGERDDEVRKCAETILDRLGAAHADLTFSGGLSASAPLSANLGGAYRQAEHALSAIPVLGSKQRVVVFDDLGVLRFLLAPADRAELVRFTRRVLGPVMDYDRDHHADLVRTVEVYLKCDCNLKRTGEELFLHPKTVRYRLDRVEELAGISFASQRHRFDAELATTIIRALSLGEGDELNR
jgi:sugar diacid utilization regulator/putative methionine-R-sulfoxide reductase with GAF domain